MFQSLRTPALRLASVIPARYASSQKYFDKILVANRGEIALRVFRTCKKLGIKTVAVYSEADKDALHVQMADEAVHIGPAPTNQSYLNAAAVLDAAKKSGAQGIHPGYGFLSENAVFSEAVTKAGIAFIGPPPAAMRALGDKIQSKHIAKAAGVNTVPGYVGEVNTEEDAIKIANQIGYPVMLKASAGGGGKGMRIAWNDDDVKTGYTISREEAKSYFGDDRLLIEKFIESPRHIEIQIMADSQGKVLYFPERECSLQRRNQKVVEEAPSVALDEATRRAMGEQAASLARAVGYQSAGTLEFLVDPKKNFYFLEMNTRLQVEHPITEYITGVDLVELMIMVAAGNPLPMNQADLKIKGWAVESRVYAEDPLKGFLPSIGHLTTYKEPVADANLRVDSGVSEGSEISVYYDPMIAKVVSYGENRMQALERQRTALDSYVIRGLNHNIPFLRSVIEHPRFVKGDLNTKFIQDEYPKGFHGHPLTVRQVKQLVASSAIMHLIRAQRDNSISDRLDSAATIDSLDIVVEAAGQRFNVHVREDGLSMESTMYAVGIKEDVQAMEGAHDEDAKSANGVFEVEASWGVDSPVFTAKMMGEAAPVVVQIVKNTPLGFRLQHVGNNFDVKVVSQREAELLPHMIEKVLPDLSRMLISPMPGALRAVHVKVGDKVTVGQPLAIVEAMKMQNILRAQQPGYIKAVFKQAGTTLAVDDIILELDDKPAVPENATV